MLSFIQMNRGIFLSLAVSIFFIPTITFGQTPMNFLPVQNSLPSNTVTIPETVASNKIDLIVEAETYTPYFYQGRSEPTAGNNIRLVALVFDQNLTPANFQWKVGNQSFTTETPVLEIELPNIGTETSATVSISDTDGVNLGSATEIIQFTKPKILFYENNDLRGTSKMAIKDNYILIGAETGIKAEPYFFGQQAILTSTVGNWTTNNINIIKTNDWRYISLVKPDEVGDISNGKASLDIRNSANINESLTGSVNINI